MRLGRQPEIWHSHMVRRYMFNFPRFQGAASGRSFNGSCRYPMVDKRYRRFVGGDGKDPAFRELLVRWFEWGAFCPVFRLHGERLPYYEREVEYIDGVRTFSSGQDNEVWSFGEENYEIMKKFLFIRENLRDYVRNCMMEAHLHGTPVMRPLFYDFPEDKTCWGYEDEYMFGPDILVAPVMEAQTFTRSVYLPAGTRWEDAASGKCLTAARM